jgi:hypothetical protein
MRKLISSGSPYEGGFIDPEWLIEIEADAVVEE